MTRIAGIVVPGLPLRVTQRDNRRERVFFEDGDYELYRDWLAQSCRKFGVAVWAYCLMPNQLRLILTPADAAGVALARASALFGPCQRAGTANRAFVPGALWFGRYGSVAMDEGHLMVAARYVVLNPERARLVRQPREWPWSNVHAHLAGRDDGGQRQAAAGLRAAFCRSHRGQTRRGLRRAAAPR
jgi:putative transposase